MVWDRSAPPMSTPRPPSPTSVAGSLSRHASPAGNSGPGPVTPPGVGRFVPRWSDPVTLTRERANPNERTIQHERFPWFDVEYMTSNHDTLVNWTDCGPTRQILHMRQVTVNRQVGTSNTRAQDPQAIRTFGTQDQGHGLHTNPEQPKAAVIRNFRGKVQQQPARVNRLSPAVYTGQSYSQTTQLQGGGRFK